MMVMMKTSDLPPSPPTPPPPPPHFPSVYVRRETFSKMSEDANEQHKVLQVQFLAADYKSQLLGTYDDQQTNLDISNSKTVTIKVTAQQINLRGNNRIFICRYPSIKDQYQDSDNDNDSKFPKIFIAKEFGDNKDELDLYEHLLSLQGVYIPKCFGEIYWKDEDEEIIYQGIALEFLEGFRCLEDTDAKNDLMYKKFKKVLEVIGSKGIFHGDIAFRNLMWHSENEEKRNFIELESIFDVKDSDIIHEYLPTNVAKPRWMLDPPVLPREMLERNDWRRTGARLRKNRWMIEGNRRDD
ncbi:hypothetical protein SS1G_09520 [Sclerotinia sclerotiorum 1980 UF-70]|uniref:Uncharacterized protein n=2 Tax=Sclerotinia sclerotiorum (strain ATCC 18683 / 1980 / Ss-1) TaxID=665079 RepID=A7EW11_SCLS1|nr:hypothetical protein SS1G_09520 [Sclerotinia sclerotiorum 1980 UF-70]APA15663.1 hypothetical protein sscle_15g104330 [Sclerotinia sclerotiorum 1980 UF-70]EDN93653.1 hypothetical protein SS1G_09520 [Sclerotinia sclerotiorum 1980 UF-70]